MAKQKTARTPYNVKPKHFIAHLYGADEPVVVTAKGRKEALKALVTLTPASADDLMNAGALSWKKVDTTALVNTSASVRVPAASSVITANGGQDAPQ
jgi:hypothetical protein